MPSVTISDDLDLVLLDAPWVGKKDQHGRSRLFKYAPTPDGTSYIMVTTDLTSIEVHNPASSEISSIPWSTEHPFLAQTQDLIQSSGLEEEEDEQRGLILDRLGEMMSASWNDVQVMCEEEEDEQPVIYIKADHFGWRFPLSPLDSTQHISFIARHLVAPLTNLIAQDRGIPIPSQTGQATTSLTTFDPTVKLISDSEISRAIKRVTSSSQAQAPPKAAAQPRSTTKRIRKAAHTYNDIDMEASSDAEVGSPTPRRPVRNAADTRPNTKQRQEGEDDGFLQQSPTKNSKSMLPPPLSDSSSLAPSSSPPRSTPPLPAPAQSLRSDKPAPSSSLPALSSTPVNSPPPPPTKKQKVEQAQAQHTRISPDLPKNKKDKDRSSPSLGSAMDFNPPSSSSRTSHTQSSQKSKKEREKEEEEEMQRKIGEMKRKMEKGGTGKLGKRRLVR
ncbi:hypothetical protein IAU59_004653 [Kwoniella sp. CBS 9459]